MHATSFYELVVLLAVAVVAVVLFRALKLSPVLGYLVAGVTVGEGGFALISDTDRTAAIGELGVVLLLFLIGLELSWDKLKTMRKKIFGIGGTQVVLTSLVLFGVARLMGFGAPQALIIACGLSFSSTALVLEVLRERRESATQTGRMALAILILQDLAVLPLLTMVPLFAHPGEHVWQTLGVILLQVLVALAAIIATGRLVLRPLFRLIARFGSNELFVATTLLVVLGISFATETVGLSPALGAFLAGLLLAETEFAHQIEADVKPFKGLLMGLFFMTVGMHIDMHYLLAHIGGILLLAFALIGLKAALLYGIVRRFGYVPRTAGHIALLLSQGGEFGFILFGFAAEACVLAPETAEPLLVIIALTMALTPLLDTIGARFERKWQLRHRPSTDELAAETRDMKSHVVIAGYGSMGEAVAHVLARENIPFIALDIEPKRVQAGRRNQHPVYFGDASRADVLAAMGAAHAELIMLTMRAESEAAKQLQLMRKHFPDKPILARALNVQSVHALVNAGATRALPELNLTSMRIVSMLLGQLEWPEAEIARVMHAMREDEDLAVPHIGV